MKLTSPSSLLCAFFGLCLLSLPAQAAGVHYDVYLLGGQSNMDGRADARTQEWESPGRGNFLNAANSAAYSKEHPDVTIYAANSLAGTWKNQWLSLKPGFGSGSDLINGYYKFGPELAFGRKMADATPGHNVALIKYSVSGTSLRDHWNPDIPGTQYTTFKTTVAAALAALTARGDTCAVRGMIWMQGEADSKFPTSTADYEAQLKNFIGRLRLDLALPNMPFVIGEIFTDTYIFRSQIRAAQLNTSNTYPYAGFATSAGLVCYDVNTHFDADSQITLGERFAEAMVTILQQNAYMLWKSRHFSVEELADSNISGDGRDPNGNALSNLLEYVLNGVPKGLSQGPEYLPAPSVDPESNRLRLAFTRSTDCSDVTLTIQAADSPAGPWTDLGRSVNGAAFTLLAEGANLTETGTGILRDTTVSDLVSITDPLHQKRFMRMQVTQ